MAKTKLEASRTCFVIMPFRRLKSLQDVYELSIKPAVEKAEFRCIRADKIPQAGMILEHILKAAYDAHVVIADVTGNNANVMYELGLAHGFAKPVVMLSQSIKETPFDLKTYRIIEYKTNFGAAGKLQEDIYSALMATLSPDTTKNRTNPARLFIPTLMDRADAVEMNQQLEMLKEENKKLQGVRDLAQSIIDNLGGRESIEEIQRDMESGPRGGSFTIDLQNEGGRQRLSFRKIDEGERVKIPPRKRT